MTSVSLNFIFVLNRKNEQPVKVQYILSMFYLMYQIKVNEMEVYKPPEEVAPFKRLYELDGSTF